MEVNAQREKSEEQDKKKKEQEGQTLTRENLYMCQEKKLEQ